MKKSILLTPGPTPLPPRVAEAMARPMTHHRTPAFRAVMKEATEGLKYVFQTKNDVHIFASSGTGAMEAAVCNLLSPGDAALTVQGGKFGERWTELCRRFGVAADVVDVEWGRAVDPAEVRRRLTANPRIKAVFSTLVETSTGVVTDIRALGRIVAESEAALVVDAVSGLGSIDLETDAWSCDVVVSCSQKGLMLPPGLGFVAASPKALGLIEASTCPRYYFDLRKSKDALERSETPFTPAISLIVALNEALGMIRREGLETVFERHRKMAESVRSGVKALGLSLFGAEAASDVVTAVYVPAGLDGEKLVEIMRDAAGITIAGGQGKLKGKIFRIAHMGFVSEADIIAGVAGLEETLARMGHRFTRGAGIGAAKEAFGAQLRPRAARGRNRGARSNRL